MFNVVDGNGILVSENEKQFLEFMAVERFVHFVGMMNPPRPGVSECITLLEHTYYKPNTPRNELFIMRIVEWANMVWVIISIPTEERSFMEQIADSCGLRIANGTPTIIDGKGVRQFPANNERVFTLENKPGHLVYQNDDRLTRQLLDAEQDVIKDL